MLAFCSFHQIREGSLLVGCDCDGAFKQASKRALNISIQTKHANIIWAIRVMVSKFKELSISVKFFHLEGHQDDFLPFEELDCPAQLNVLMDRAAKAKIDILAQGIIHPTPPGIQFEGWTCTIDGVKATTDPLDAIMRAIHKGPMISYLLDPKRNRMSVAAFDLIDWSVVWESLLGFAPLFRMWASKHVSRYCAVGHMQIRWGFWDHDHCPCCHLPNEMTTHLLLCQHPGMKLTWSIQVDTLKDWMEEVDTHPNIIECFITMLTT